MIRTETKSTGKPGVRPEKKQGEKAEEKSVVRLANLDFQKKMEKGGETNSEAGKKQVMRTKGKAGGETTIRTGRELERRPKMRKAVSEGRSMG